MSNLYENIDYLCKQNNTNITQMCKNLGIVRSALSELASQRTKSLSADNKAKIAAFFKVDIEFLDNDFGIAPCPLCGFNYVPSEKGENARHEAKHKKWLKAVKHFGFCWNWIYRENAKARARNMIDSKTMSLSDEEIVECYETIYRALFSRALEASDYSIDTISFNDYVSSILFNKKHDVPEVGTNVYNLLVKKYGAKKGNVDGTYFDVSKSGDEAKRKLKHTTKNIEHSNLSGVIPSQNIYQIPVFASVSAGFGAYASNDILEYIPMVIDNPYDADDTIGIRVCGDSMYPKIEDGDIIVVRKQDSVDSGDIAVLLLDGEEGLVKKVVYGETWIELHSFNPEYKTRRFENEEVLRLRVVGLVVGSYKKF